MTSANSIQPAMNIPSEEVFPYSYEKQEEIQSIQDEIDQVVTDVQWAFFNEVHNSSSSLVKHFKNFADTINEQHASILSDFIQLPENSCRDNAETLINTTRTQTGFNGGNCANRVNNAITSILARTDSLYEDFNRQFSEIQQIVVKSYIKSNLFIDSTELVKGNMDENFNLVKTRWDELKPNFNSIREQLKADLNEEDAKLTICHLDSVAFAESMYRLTRSQIEVCQENAAAGVARARVANEHNYVAEALSFMNSFEVRYAH